MRLGVRVRRPVHSWTRGEKTASKSIKTSDSKLCGALLLYSWISSRSSGETVEGA